MNERRLRLGIDVGGTFTDVVAIDAVTRELVARVKVPTTHDAAEGVAAGIVAGVRLLLERAQIAPDEVAFIAHSTTQATNALLEGDVASVGVVALLSPGTLLARRQMRIAPMPLAPGAVFTPQTVYAKASDEAGIRSAVDRLRAVGVGAIAASEAFGVDRPAAENATVAYARSLGMLATSGHDVASTYGLRARTRTAALNAAILPTMVRTARMTAGAVNAAMIAAPLMIMRSDGGVMDVREIERRPILTLLSGPAAGIAGALLYENVTDGIFIEVGGTSSDCSAIRAGMPQMRPAKVGGHRTMLRTLDVRTLAIAGGSMARVSASGISDVGPRSAHIAGCLYASFVEAARLVGAHLERIAPTPRDPDDYAVLVTTDGARVALTPTCASNLLGYVPQGAFSFGKLESVTRAFAILGEALGADPQALATQLLDAASAKLLAGVEELIADYGLERDALVLVGGGGGATALVPYAAKRASLAHTIARDAEVISPIGVALALVRDVVERTIVNPSPDDIVKIRREASDRVIAAGASPDRVEVAVEIDTQRNRVRATASGATAMVEAAAHGVRDEDARRTAAARSLRVDGDSVTRIASAGALDVFASGRDVRVVDDRGVVRLGLRGARVTQTTAGEIGTSLRGAIEDATNFGDVGRALPNVYVLHGARMADFSGLASADQAIALAVEELAGREPSAPVVILAAPNRA
ncbi:MAG: hydantoinase/oxoprolinase [Candidatus Eremiobacteraeota bacterium]|nr:hydantoinase/oxoprolinase [Candidatus Eremiobacteraeota bacterium]